MQERGFLDAELERRAQNSSSIETTIEQDKKLSERLELELAEKMTPSPIGDRLRQQIEKLVAAVKGNELQRAATQQALYKSLARSNKLQVTLGTMATLRNVLLGVLAVLGASLFFTYSSNLFQRGERPVATEKFREGAAPHDTGLQRVAAALTPHAFHVQPDVHSGFVASHLRLSEEVQGQIRRANFNLALGATLAVVGIVILGLVVFLSTGGDVILSDNVGVTSEPKIVPEITARACLQQVVSLTFQVFAFFFLSLYRSGLNEIKYFQNEITNIELKAVAVSAAREWERSAAVVAEQPILLAPDTQGAPPAAAGVDVPRIKSRDGGTKIQVDGLARLVVETLVRTERNFRLKHNEKTVHLYQEELARDPIALLRDALLASLRQTPDAKS